jgi:hypothetical protein
MKSKKETSEYAPWEIEKKEKQNRKRGIPPSNEKLHLHSKPKSKNHSHLEMYILAIEKERLEKYGSTLGRRVKNIATKWKETKARMHDLQKTSAKISKEGIDELIEGKKEKRDKTKKEMQENVQKVDWKY